MTETLERPTYVPKADHMPIEAVDHLELWVGNARQAAYYWEHALGFKQVAYTGLETGNRSHVGYVMAQGEIRIVLTGALGPEGPVTEFVHAHGDGVKRIALRVPDCAAAFREAVARGARPEAEPSFEEDADGRAGFSTIKLYGDVIMTFVERADYHGAFLPRYRAAGDGSEKHRGVGIAAIDHVVGNVALGDMNVWVKWFEDVLGFEQLQHFTDEAISTEYSALMSKVMQNGSGKVKFPINEPAQGKKKSQIEEYLEFNRAPGVQHVALITGDVIQTVDELQKRGVEFLTVPTSYYDDLWKRVGEIREDVREIERLNIMVDRDDEGYLLQIFSKPVQDRPTMFFEVIQRRGSRGFGEGNFKALFEAIEREQDKRGNL
ncbi:MAG: 4-hydroxyphenylpyruvate dioxygenase [Chloroflexota bacterium]|jgi:4-hydroxyphenylpyruvate dioxygenase|nr:4-hydroxyphenylpyruvate dioxygenase [Chloroflexota bacterium]